MYLHAFFLDGDEEGLVGDAAAGDQDVAVGEGFGAAVVAELEGVGLVELQDIPLVLENVVDEDLVFVAEEADFGTGDFWLKIIPFCIL